jgi:hypothetical protein
MTMRATKVTIKRPKTTLTIPILLLLIIPFGSLLPGESAGSKELVSGFRSDRVSLWVAELALTDDQRPGHCPIVDAQYGT